MSDKPAVSEKKKKKKKPQHYWTYVVIMTVRYMRWLLPVLISCSLYYGPLNDEFRSDTVSFRYIEKHEIKVETQKEKAFIYLDYNTYTVKNITITANTKDISHTVLDQLLKQWLVDPTGMGNSSKAIQNKTKLLLKVSSPDFWNKNFNLHGKGGRIGWWMWVHGRYLWYVRSLQDISNRKTLESSFRKIIRKLGKHSYYEEIIFYPFLRDNYEIYQLIGTAEQLNDVLETMKSEHIPIHNLEDVILEEIKDETKSLNDIKKTMLKWQRLMEKHFLKEEQQMVHLCLKFANSTYKRYLYYISFGYLFHALESFVDYTLQLFYIIN